jgi:hypothetical protein
VIDMFGNDEIGIVDDLHSFSLELDGFGGTSLLVREPAQGP